MQVIIEYLGRDLITFEPELVNIKNVKTNINKDGERNTSEHIEFFVPWDGTSTKGFSFPDKLFGPDEIQRIVVITNKNNYEFWYPELRSLNRISSDNYQVIFKCC